MAEAHIQRSSGRAVGIFLVIAAMLIVVFGSGSHFGGGSHITNLDGESAVSVLAARAHKLRVTPEITDEALQQALDALQARAAKGDVDAAAFIFELAAIQRAQQEEQTDADNEVAQATE